MRISRRLLASLAVGGVAAGSLTLTAPAGAAATITLDPIGSTGALGAGAAEIVAFDPVTKRAFVTNDSGTLTRIDVWDLTNPAAPASAGSFDLSPYGTSVQSVAVRNGKVAAAVAPTAYNAKGRVVVFTASTLTLLGTAEVGYLPDGIAFTPDGTKVVTADEGQPGCNGAIVDDVPGSVSIVDVSGAGPVFPVAQATFNASHLVPGLRTNLTVPASPNDIEPEYVVVSPDGSTAYVSLQENNAIATIAIASASVTAIGVLPNKDHSLPGRGLDPSDRDSAANGAAINIVNRPLRGMPMPDGVATFTIGTTTYLATANEGDGREYPSCFTRDDPRLSAIDLDNAVFGATEAILKGDGPNGMGRLRVSRTDGDLGNDGDIDVIHAFGTRSMGIYLPDGTQVGDTGDTLEQYIAATYPAAFNTDAEGATFDQRSPNKGPEPEAVVVATINGTAYAFLALERMGGIATFDLSNPATPVLADYVNPKLEPAVQPGDGDGGPEGLAFVAAADSPTGKPLLLVANEISGSTTVYEITQTPDPTIVIPEVPMAVLLPLSALALAGGAVVVLRRRDGLRSA